MAYMWAKKEEYKEPKTCTRCGRYLDERYPEDICHTCKEMNLFAEVKEYIRKNDVKEVDVAEKFNIPVSKVRGWIREGRIQYKGIGDNTISGVNCQICGKAIDFGTICPDCHRMKGLQVVAKHYQEEKSMMRFLGKDSEK